MALQLAPKFVQSNVTEPTWWGLLNSSPASVCSQPHFWHSENDIWQVAAPTRCGGHVGNSPPVVGCSACGLVLRGLKNEMCVCSSEHFCCQVSAVPICSIRRASWTRSAINQTATTAERAGRELARSSARKEITATRDFIKRLQLLCP